MAINKYNKEKHAMFYLFVSDSVFHSLYVPKPRQSQTALCTTMPYKYPAVLSCPAVGLFWKFRLG